jgi:hypothetical protein
MLTPRAKQPQTAALDAMWAIVGRDATLAPIPSTGDLL